VSTPFLASNQSLPSDEEVRTVVASVLAGLPADDLPLSSLDHARERTSEATLSGSDASRPTTVAVGADHGGYRLKERLTAELRERGVEIHDCGTNSTEPVDYPDFAHHVARAVADGACQSGIIVDGAGIGSCMVANKVPGIRAATCWDLSSARNSREHNHANVLVLGAGLIGENLALEIVQLWLSTPWGGGRHARRVEKIAEIERRYLARTEAGSTR
jgi:ribose 5-phosphate isomerase B